MPDTVPPEPQLFRFGLFEVDLRSGELRRQGVQIKLQQQPFQVLVMLLEQPGELVTREEIQERLWPDTIVEFESNLNAAIKRLREVLGDSAGNPRFVETIPRRGYRFIAADRLRGSTSGAGADASDPSIAVLPFLDRNPQQDQEYFCDGITEELTDALTEVENLRVVSRISAFQYKNKTEDVRKIGSALNVGTLLEGSLRRTENKLRITARLTNVKDGCHIWTESYECDVRDVFDIQDEITAAIMNTLTGELGWKLSRTTGPRLVLSKPALTKDLVAHDLYLQGQYFWNQKNEQGAKKSIECFERAIEKDPDYALAHAALADSYMILASLENNPAERTRLYSAAQEKLEKYLRMSEENYQHKGLKSDSASR
jgi:TolB-like protein